MKSFLVSILILVSVSVFADLSDACVYSFFNDGGIASSQCFGDENTTQTTRVFNRSGAQIGEWTIMTRPRTSSISMSFYPDGMIRRVRYSFQPDGGIQWYRSTTVYDQEGRITSFHEDSWDAIERIHQH
jgi:hypothetical protein